MTEETKTEDETTRFINGYRLIYDFTWGKNGLYPGSAKGLELSLCNSDATKGETVVITNRKEIENVLFNFYMQGRFIINSNFDIEDIIRRIEDDFDKFHDNTSLENRKTENHESAFRKTKPEVRIIIKKRRPVVKFIYRNKQGSKITPESYSIAILSHLDRTEFQGRYLEFKRRFVPEDSDQPKEYAYRLSRSLIKERKLDELIFLILEEKLRIRDVKLDNLNQKSSIVYSGKLQGKYGWIHEEARFDFENMPVLYNSGFKREVTDYLRRFLTVVTRHGEFGDKHSTVGRDILYNFSQECNKPEYFSRNHPRGNILEYFTQVGLPMKQLISQYVQNISRKLKEETQ